MSKVNMTGADGGPAATPRKDTAERLRGFGPLGLLAILLILAGGVLGPLVSSILILLWAWVSHTPWQDLGFAKPRRWVLTVVGGIVFGMVFKLIMKVVVMPLLGAPAINERYHYLVGNTAALPMIMVYVVLSAGFGEEVFFRSYLFERLGRLLGSGKIALTAIILFSAGLFALAHYPDQRLPGVEQAAVTGLLFGSIFAWRKQIWVLMIAHAAFDLTAIAIIYWNWEIPLAQLIFK